MTLCAWFVVPDLPTVCIVTVLAAVVWALDRHLGPGRWFAEWDRDGQRTRELKVAMYRGDVEALAEGAELAARLASKGLVLARVFRRSRVPFVEKQIRETERWSLSWQRAAFACRRRSRLVHLRGLHGHRGRTRAQRSSRAIRFRGSRGRRTGAQRGRASPSQDGDGPSSSDPPSSRAREARP